MLSFSPNLSLNICRYFYSLGRKNKTENGQEERRKSEGGQEALSNREI